jgi:hypothetical protein
MSEIAAQMIGFAPCSGVRAKNQDMILIISTYERFIYDLENGLTLQGY